MPRKKKILLSDEDFRIHGMSVEERRSRMELLYVYVRGFYYGTIAIYSGGAQTREYKICDAVDRNFPHLKGRHGMGAYEVRPFRILTQRELIS